MSVYLFEALNRVLSHFSRNNPLGSVFVVFQQIRCIAYVTQRNQLHPNGVSSKQRNRYIFFIAPFLCWNVRQKAEQ